MGIEETGDSEPVSLSVVVNQVIARMNIYPDMAGSVKR